MNCPSQILPIFEVGGHDVAGPHMHPLFFLFDSDNELRNGVDYIGSGLRNSMEKHSLLGVLASRIDWPREAPIKDRQASHDTGGINYF